MSLNHPQLTLLPQPRQLTFLQGNTPIAAGGTLSTNSQDAQAVMFSALLLQRKLKDETNAPWELRAGITPPGRTSSIVLNQLPGGVSRVQGYVLLINQGRIDIIASDSSGIFYGVQTLIQIIQQSEDDLPDLRCSDWPDFPHRGVMLDISRDKVPTMQTLYALVDLLASWKANQLQLYTEHTFAYQNHSTVWADASPMTGEEILLLDAYCRERFIELVPNQNSFGHMNRWLQHAEYVHLAECPDGFETLWGLQSGPFTLAPTDPDSLKLVQGLFDELLPHFSSRQVNVGCDETFDLGLGKSKALVEQVGEGRVYLDFLLAIYQDLKARGKTMQFWGDILMNHPQLVSELPRDVIALEWGYEAAHPFDAHGAIFAASGIPFYVCPGTSSWNTLSGRTDNALENIRNAAENGIKHGAVGFLNTDWGDNGHWQPLPVSYIGIAYGSALAWAYDANRDVDIAEAVSIYAFQDETNVIGRIAYDLGNVYQMSDLLPPNASILFRILQFTPEDLAMHVSDAAQRIDEFKNIQGRIDEIMASISAAKIRRDDASLIEQEFIWVADMLRHACQRMIWALGLATDQEDLSLRQALMKDAEILMEVYQEIWHARNRPGGFKESLARMEDMRDGYIN